MTPLRRRAAILYAELRNFTRLSEVLEPAKVLQLANDFFTLAARNVVAERGEVLSVQNDSLVAAFHSEGREFADWTLKAAQAVQREFGTLGEKWKSEYGLPAAVGLGVHLGEAVVRMGGPLRKPPFFPFGAFGTLAQPLASRARTRGSLISPGFTKALRPAGPRAGAP